LAGEGVLLFRNSMKDITSARLSDAPCELENRRTITIFVGES
jgi:hypothetical protein